jgi:hypothetical protein
MGKLQNSLTLRQRVSIQVQTQKTLHQVEPVGPQRGGGAQPGKRQSWIIPGT